MIYNFLRVIFSILGLLLGYGTVEMFNKSEIVNLVNGKTSTILIYIGVSLLFGIIFFILSPAFLRKLKKFIKFIENELQNIPASDIALGSGGLIIGLIIAYLISQLFNNIGPLGLSLSIIVYIVFGYLGVSIPTRKKDDILSSIPSITRKVGKENPAGKNEKLSMPKILDTSVIIDGRIADICKTGFIEGPLIIPEFVLGELQHIADSSDDLKRNRGRRGLDILNIIQKELDMEVIISDKKYKEEKEVDAKLLKLTKELDGKILTNDYNLNKVAEVQSIPVLNINDLANAVKPVVLPGEEMVVQVIKSGKESGQGLAYLDDGTMIVVESGKKYIGQTIDVLVTSVLQTSAGRMIFARPNL